MIAVSTPAEQMAAVLHDVVEDTAVTLAQLREEGFPAEVLEAVEVLTHDAATPYLDYVRRAGMHVVARAVKVADLRDNLDASRPPEVTERDHERFRRYEAALALLNSDGVCKRTTSTDRRQRVTASPVRDVGCSAGVR
jgi:hypothetical protein